MTELLLSEFEAWCRGEGRGGQGAGNHYHSLQDVARFRDFKRGQEQDQQETENKEK